MAAMSAMSAMILDRGCASSAKAESFAGLCRTRLPPLVHPFPQPPRNTARSPIRSLPGCRAEFRTSFGNEAAERFSFYGMRSILIVFMTSYLMGANGELAVMPPNEAAGWFHQFVVVAYLMPILGALLSDGVLGKYRTIISLSIVYCLGHLALALNDTRIGLFLGLLLISLGE
jgi:dipeptide/tripeptide permease